MGELKEYENYLNDRVCDALMKGELEKRARKLKWGAGRCLCCGKLKDGDVGLYTILDLIAEARCEFPLLNWVNESESEWDTEIYPHASLAIMQWFMKWFGQ